MTKYIHTTLPDGSTRSQLDPCTATIHDGWMDETCICKGSMNLPPNLSQYQRELHRTTIPMKCRTIDCNNSAVYMGLPCIPCFSKSQVTSEAIQTLESSGVLMAAMSKARINALFIGSLPLAQDHEVWYSWYLQFFHPNPANRDWSCTTLTQLADQLRYDSVLSTEEGYQPHWYPAEVLYHTTNAILYALYHGMESKNNLCPLGCYDVTVWVHNAVKASKDMLVKAKDLDQV